MKTKSEHISTLDPVRANALRARQRDDKKGERGNALIYVLIAIALFGALSFTLSRQTDTSEAGGLSDEIAELRATQLISYSAQVKSAIDQMLFTGASSIDELDFTVPTDASFDSGTLIHKVYHPQGGGITPGTLPEDAVAQVITDPVAGWYMGRFNSIEWTASASSEVLLTAFQIDEKVCGLVNEKITGSTTIPSATVALRNLLIEDSLHGGTNQDITTKTSPNCADCDELGSLCVEEGGLYAFYTVIADQ